MSNSLMSSSVNRQLRIDRYLLPYFAANTINRNLSYLHIELNVSKITVDMYAIQNIYYSKSRITEPSVSKEIRNWRIGMA